MFKLYFKYLKYYKKEVILGPLFKLLEAVFELIVPIIMARIIDKGINLGDTNYIIRMGILLFVIAVVGFCSTLICQYFASKASQGVGTRLRDDLFRHIENLDFEELEQIGGSELLTRINNDVNQVQLSVAMLIRLVIRAPFIVIGAIVISFIINIKIGLIFLVVGLLILISVLLIMYFSIPRNKVVQKDLEKVTQIAKENLSGIRVVKAFNKEEYESNRFKLANSNLKLDSDKVAKISALLNPISAILIALAIALVLYYSGDLVYIGSITQGNVTALVNYLNQILTAIFVVCNLIQIFAKAFSSLSRLDGLFSLKPNIKYGNVTEIKETEEVFSLNQVSYCHPYASKDTLSNISFNIKKGSFTGIIGGTGSGKTTLLYLLAHFYEAKEGTILYNNLPIEEYDKKVLSDSIGFVFQQSLLANMTIRDNLKLKDKNISDKRLEEVLNIAQANFILESKDSLDKLIYQGGKNLSGGEKQRVSIARALTNKPKVLILDDSLSALDMRTDYNLRKALKSLDMTIILVTQRINQIKDADNIIVMDNGSVVGLGKHEELLKSSKVYKEIYDSQNEGEV